MQTDEKQFYVYIMTNKVNTVLYTGVTSDLQARVYQHKEGLTPGFSKRYRVYKLVYYEEVADALSAIACEKQIKAGTRKKKLELVNRMNPQWLDLYELL